MQPRPASVHGAGALLCVAPGGGRMRRVADRLDRSTSGSGGSARTRLAPSTRRWADWPMKCCPDSGCTATGYRLSCEGRQHPC